MGTTHRRRGFTSTDLIIAAALAVLLIPLAASVVQKSIETANRVKCASHLKGIGQAILLYENENNGEFPRTRYRPESADAPAAWTGASTTRPFAVDGPAINDVTAAAHLLLTTQELVPEFFLDPSSSVADLEFAKARWKSDRPVANFLDERELSYSFANPYPTKTATDAGYKLDVTASVDFAVAADINPGIDPPDADVTSIVSTSSNRDTRRGNSPNHARDGQNVLYGDGHVEFVNTPFVGVNRDNLYTFGRRETPAAGFGVVGSPVDKDDSVLLPAVNGDFWREHPYVPPRSIAPWTLFAPAIAIGIALLFWRLGRGSVIRAARPALPA